MANEKLVNRENLKAFREKYDERLENGQVIPSKSLVAKELETISPESGDTQETPFALQGTGTANGTSSVDTGTVGKHIQKQGSVYCVNNYAEHSSDSVSATAWSRTQNKVGSCINGHKYLIKVNSSVTTSVHLFFATPNGSIGLTINNSSLFKLNQGTNYILAVAVMDATSIFIQNNSQLDDDVDLTNINFIDLTQWFNGNIPQDLLDNPSHWSWYQTYGDYIPYNTGTLVSGNGRYLVCGGRNVWDEEWELGGVSISTGQNGGSDQIGTGRAINYIPVISSQDYYFKTPEKVYVFYYDENKNYISYSSINSNSTFTTPNHCSYIRFVTISAYGNTYKHDITISLYYAGEDYSQYYPYEQPKVYDTGSETLLSTGVKLSVSGEREDIYDYKEPNGLITRRVGIVVLDGSDDENWSLITSGFFNVDNIISGSSYTVSDNSISAIDYQHITQICGSNSVFQNATTNYTKAWQKHYNGTGFRFKNSNYSDLTSWKTYLSNNPITIYYELATHTTEQGTPFSENIEINDFGTMGWYATYTDANTNALVSVPQGCKIFYPAWYVGFIDTLGQRADIDWNANNVVSQTELGVVDTKHDNLYSIIQENVGGTLRHMISGVDFNNTAWVDLGTLTYTKSSNNRFVASSDISYIKAPSGNTVNANILCSVLRTDNADNVYLNTNENSIAFSSSRQLVIFISSTYYSNNSADQFKNAMKGVILAYEKA